MACMFMKTRRGIMRLTIEKKKQNLQAHYSFNGLAEGWQVLRKLVRQFELCPRLCFIQKGNETCAGLGDKSCRGACEQKESAMDYNRRYWMPCDPCRKCFLLL